MANYSLVINSKFKPFSYQELLQPALMSTQAHQAVEDAYSELATKANIWDKMTDPGSKAHGMYEAYARDLEQQAEQLSRYGLTPSSRQQMLNMKSRYSSDIVPIEQAYDRRKEQAKQQAEIMAKDPTHFFARMASTTSLDDYIANPSLDTISQNYSGALLTQQVSQAAAALAKDARNDPNVRTELRKLLPYQYETIRRTGFDPKTIRQAILNSSDANKILTGIVDTAMANSGMNDWNYMSPEDKQRILTQARQYANQGLWSAVGQTQYGSVTDQAGLAKYQQELALDTERKKAAIKAAQDEEELAKAIGLRGTSYIVASGKDKEYLQAINELKAGKSGLNANIFGKHGNVNALKVYEDYQKAIRAVEREYSARTRIDYPKGTGSYGTIGEAMSQSISGGSRPKRMSEDEAKAEAGQKVLEQYGVSRVLTKGQYEALKGIGYNGDTVTKYDDLATKLNALSQYKTYFSTNMGDYDYADGVIRPTLGNWNINDTFAGRVYSINSDGSRGKAVSYKDLNLYDPQSKKDGRKITDIAYDVNHPKQLIVQIGESGERYLMDPNILGTEVATFLEDASSRITKGNESLAGHATTVSLAKMLNDFNQVKSKTSSKAAD